MVEDKIQRSAEAAVPAHHSPTWPNGLGRNELFSYSKQETPCNSANHFPFRPKGLVKLQQSRKHPQREPRPLVLQLEHARGRQRMVPKVGSPCS